MCLYRHFYHVKKKEKRDPGNRKRGEKKRETKGRERAPSVSPTKKENTFLPPLRPGLGPGGKGGKIGELKEKDTWGRNSFYFIK